MKLSEYLIYRDAAILRTADDLEKLAIQAMYNRRVEEADKKGVYTVQKISDLFNLKEVEESILGPSSLFDDRTRKYLMEVNSRMEQYYKEKGGADNGTQS